MKSLISPVLQISKISETFQFHEWYQKNFWRRFQYCNMLMEHATCKMELFVTITIGKGALADNIAHTVSTCEFIGFCVSSFGPISFQLVLASPRSFRLVPGGSSSFFILVCTLSVIQFNFAFSLAVRKMITANFE